MNDMPETSTIRLPARSKDSDRSPNGGGKPLRYLQETHKASSLTENSYRRLRHVDQQGACWSTAGAGRSGSRC